MMFENIIKSALSRVVIALVASFGGFAAANYPVVADAFCQAEIVEGQ